MRNVLQRPLAVPAAEKIRMGRAFLRVTPENVGEDGALSRTIRGESSRHVARPLCRRSAALDG
jgi:hypothetical protein